MRFGWGLIVCMVLGLAATGRGAPVARPEQAWNCSARDAAATALGALAADPTAFRGKCVRVQGLLIGPALYSDVDGYYMAGSQIGVLDPSDPARLHRIGLIFPSRYHALQMAQARDAQVIGSVTVCEAHRKSPPGYCRSADGVAIVVTSLNSSPHVLRRLVDDASRARVGNLRPVVSGSADGKSLSKTAHDVLADIRSGDVAAFTALEPGGDSDLIPGRHHALIFKDPNSPYASLRTAGADPQIALFRVIRRRGESEEGAPDHRAVFCYCRDRECSGRWPISVADAANSVERPYVCFARGTGRSGAFVTADEEIRAVKEPQSRAPRP